jgi:hypothetical protein
MRMKGSAPRRHAINDDDLGEIGELMDLVESISNIDSLTNIRSFNEEFQEYSSEPTIEVSTLAERLLFHWKADWLKLN